MRSRHGRVAAESRPRTTTRKTRRRVCPTGRNTRRFSSKKLEPPRLLRRAIRRRGRAMGCETTRHRLGAYLDGELSAEDRRVVEAHVAECAGCQAELKTEHAIAAELSIPTSAKVPDGLWEAIEDELDAQRRAQPSENPVRPGLRRFGTRRKNRKSKYTGRLTEVSGAQIRPELSYSQRLKAGTIHTLAHMSRRPSA